MKSYHYMLPELYSVVVLFHQHNLQYNLFKCEHIFAGKNDNLDILFLTEQDYHKAGSILKEQGYILYLSERIERYKEMYIKVEGAVLFAIHLHREVSWHNLRILNKRDIFQRKRQEDDYISIPSSEDSLLIHVSHIIFENFSIKPYNHALLTSLLSRPLDEKYIKKNSKQYHLQPAFSHILTVVKDHQKLELSVLYQTIIKKVLFTPTSWLSLSGKVVRSILRHLSLKKKGCLISFIGVPGTGKTTLTRELLCQYESITSFFHGQSGYYLGWESFSWYSKILSTLLKKRNKKIFENMNNQKLDQMTVKINIKKRLFMELLFVYNYLEYLQRYFFVIYPLLRKNKLVVTDRYFYDIYSQYIYAPHSLTLKFLMKIFPKPDYLFILTADTKTILSRGKNPLIYSTIQKSSLRLPADPAAIEIQKKRYETIKHLFAAEEIDTERDQITNSKYIIQKSWKALAT